MTAARGRTRSRDAELVTFVGRHGIVGLGQVMAAMGAGRTASYRRIAACVDLGLLERVRLLRDEPTVIRATREGLAYAALPLPVAKVKPGLVAHHLRCVDVALRAGEHHGHDHILTEREFTWRERVEERPIAMVRVGARRGGIPMTHRADLAILSGKGVLAVEVELSAKAPRRLEALVGAWRVAVLQGVVVGVMYVCAPGTTRRAVDRAVSRTGAGDVIRVGELPA